MTYASAVLADSPLAYWRLDNGLTGGYLDSAIGKNTLLPNGTITQAAGPISGSHGLTFDGSTGYLQSPNDIADSQFSIEVWVKTTATSGLIVSDRGSSGFSFTLGMGPAPVGGGGNGQLWCGIDGMNLAAGISSTATYNDGNWHHVVAVFNGTKGSQVTSSQMTLYVDGTAAATSATGSYGSTTAPLVGSGGYSFGKNGGGTFPALAGTIARPALFRKALTATQVSAHYAATDTTAHYDSTVLADGPFGYWELEDTPAAVTGSTTSTDVTGSGRDATFSAVPRTAAALIAGDQDPAIGLSGGVRGTVGYSSWLESAQITAEAWIRPSLINTSAQGILTRREGAGSDNTFSLRINGSHLEALVWQGTSGAMLDLTGTTVLQSGATYYVALTVSSTTATLYLNGAVEATAACTGAYVGNASSLYLGAWGSLVEAFSGLMDEAAYYGTALPASRIAAHYQAGAAPSTALSGSGALTASGSAPSTPTAALSGGGALAVTGAPSASAGSAVAGSGATATTTTPGVAGAATVAGAGQLTAAQLGVGSASTSGSGQLTAAMISAAAASLTGSGQLAASGIRTFKASVSGSGTLKARAEAIVSAALAGSGTLTTAATAQPHGTAAFTGSGSLTISGVAHCPLQSEIQIITVLPDSLTVALVDATPNTSVTFNVAGTDMYTATTDADGFLAPFSLPLPAGLVNGTTYTVTVTASDDTLSSSATFVADTDDNLPDIIQGVDADPQAVPSALTATGVYKWVLQDLMPGGLGSYVMPVNPTSMTSPHYERQLANVHTTALSGQYHVHESNRQPHQWQFTGVTVSQQMHDMLRAFGDLKRRFYVIDHRNRAWLVVFTNVDLKARRRADYNGALTDWLHDYTVTAEIYDQNWRTPV